jgi:peptide/nickel transport system substrate-binding protein
VPRAWLLIVLLAAGCSSSASPSASAEGDGVNGGTLRAGLWISDEDPPDVGRLILDPQAYWTHPLARCCLNRTLLTYEGRSIEDGGAQLRPDLASEMPDVSPDGLTWTFHLRDGLRYAPPFQEREIVAGDFITALERTARIGELPHAFVVEGVEEYAAGSAATISGVEAPDDRTITFRLVEPTGAFGNVVAMPFLSPVPAEALEVHDEEYGGFAVATGPYMVDGAGAIDPRDPEAAPIWDLDELVLVRNPSWSHETDPVRPAYVDRIEIVTLPDRGSSALSAVVDGDVDVFMAPMLSSTRDEVAADPELRRRLHDAPATNLFFIPLNLALPPFDDVAVRRAVNLVLDREALAATFDPQRGSAFVPTAHAFPDVAVGGLLRDYVPSGIDDARGDSDRARELMSHSAYDSDGDGRCDGDACTVNANRWGPTTDEAVAILDADLAELGIHLDWLELDERTMFDPTHHVGLLAILGWVAEYPSANDFVGLMTDPQPPETLDLSLLGATSAQLESWGYSVPSVPSLDDKIAACQIRAGSGAFGCWAELDQLLSDQVVAWVPVARSVVSWLPSERVAHFENDGSDIIPALERVSLTPEAAP